MSSHGGNTVTARKGGRAAAGAATAGIACPACGAGNARAAAFCANRERRKALGPFVYVREEMEARARRHELLADRVAAFVGRPPFLAAHALWFVTWLAVNTGVIAVVSRFDNYPFDLISIILAVEAVFITGFVLISQNRQNAHAELRAEPDYEVNVKTYREIGELKNLLREVSARLA